MAPPTVAPLVTALLDQVAAWEALAVKTRQRADARIPDDLAPAYLYEIVFLLESGAEILRELVREAQEGR